MRILYFTRDLTTHDVLFANGIAESGREVFYLRLEHDGVAYVPEASVRGVTHVAWTGACATVSSPQQVLALLPAFLDVMSDVKPDIVHAGPIQSCALLSVLANVRPTVAMSWGSDILVDARRDAWNAWATRRVLGGASGFVCDSNAVREAAASVHALPADRVVQFPWGLDLATHAATDNARAAARQALAWDDNVIVISARAWHTSYRIDHVIDAFASAHRADPRLRLILAGSGNEAATVRVEDHVRASGLGDSIARPGMLDAEHLALYLAASDIYISAVPTDGSSISLLQAMRAGLPAVVIDNAGNREWITNDVHGRLVAAGDISAMSESLAWLAANAEQARAFGKASQLRVLERANWNANLPRLFSLYGRIA